MTPETPDFTKLAATIQERHCSSAPRMDAKSCADLLPMESWCQWCKQRAIRSALLAADALRLAHEQVMAENAEAAGCDGNCGCVIGSRHMWWNAFGNERQQLAALRAAVREYIEAAEDYRIHSELARDIEGVDKTVRFLESRNAVRTLLQSDTETR